jgi:putative NADPH-quinone reductase
MTNPLINVDLPSIGQTDRAKKILAINASPRGRKGNTERVLQPFLQGARETSAIIETIYLRDKNIHYCSGCFTCWTKTPGVCAHKDDMPDLLDKIRQADILVYAVPLYSYSVTGLMKTYLDRNLPLAMPFMVKEGDQYVHPMRHPEAWPKKLVVISTCGFPEPHHFSGLVEMFHRLTSRPALELAGMILCPGGELLRQPALQDVLQWYFDAAHCAGREVCNLGHIAPETQTTLSRPLMPDTDAFANMANAHWDQILAHTADAK